MEYIRYTDAGKYELISPGNASTGITGAIREPTSGEFKGKNAIAALVTVEDNTINFTLSGATATAKSGTNAGHQMDAGQSYLIEGARNVTAFRCIDRVSGSASIVKITTFF